MDAAQDAGEVRSVLVVGAGPAGIAMARELAAAGIDDYEVLEKAEGVGGTWRQNRYPGVACDIPAAYYCYRSDPNTDARALFATGAELRAYFERVATEGGVLEHVRCATEVASAEWTGAHWLVTTTAGERLRYRVVVGAVGRLNRPRYPDLPGWRDFAGVLRHSSEWDPATEVAGRRVGVVGAGSSGVQVVGALAGVAAHVDLFVRTPNWVMPLPDVPVPDDLRDLLASDPAVAQARYREVEQLVRQNAEAAASPGSPAAQRREAAIRGALAGVRDPVLRAQLTPRHEIGCKRLVVSATFYDTVQRDDVSVVTDPVERVEAAGVVTANGERRPLDVLVLATGFHADNFLRPVRVTGQAGEALDDLWAQDFVNYKSVALPLMPNFFLVNGPYSPSANVSVLALIEVHARYVAELVARALTDHVALAPRLDRTRELLAVVRERAARTVMATGGCDSWFLGRDGVPIVSPALPTEQEADLARVRWSDFEVRQLTGSAHG
jgi:cation diffusion facilitator CzcD-associated flavoprotein CzcO